MRRITLFLTSLLCVFALALAQNKTVRGVVISAEDNQPLPGVNLVVVGQETIGGNTNLDGKFSFSVPASAKALKVSFVGFATQEVPITSGEMRIVLKTDAGVLDELVVLGYGSQRKITNITASVAKVSSEQIANKPVPNVMDALQGKVSGLQVFTSSGEPGATSSVRLHGAGSLSLDNSPLYVVDGVPVSAGTVQGMNPNDYADVQVLKDASATSIYGARAANGVIFITTKKGKSSDRAKVNVSAQYGVSNLANADFFSGLLSGPELIAFQQELGMITEAEAQQRLQEYPFNTEWYNYFYRPNRPTYDINANISGGTGSTQYYLSGGLHGTKGLRPRSGYDRATFRANLATRLNDYVRITLNNSLSYDKVQSTFGGGAYLNGGLGYLYPSYYPTPYGENGEVLDDRKAPGSNLKDIFYVGKKNPSRTGTFNLNTVATAVITPIKNLTINSTVGLNYANTDYEYSYLPSDFESGGIGDRSRRSGISADWTFTNTAEYKWDINDDHSLTLLAGHEYLSYDFKNLSASGGGIVHDDMNSLAHAVKDKSVSESFSQAAMLSFFGRLSYSLLDRYSVDLTLRNDASSRFDKVRRNGNFWSVGLLWRVSKENFLKDVKAINHANVRFSIGTSGNNGVGNYDYQRLAGRTGMYNGSVGWGVTSVGNPELTWEKQQKAVLGFDVRLFDRLNVNLEFYDRKTIDMLMGVPQPRTTGVSSLTENVASYLNRGVDLRLDYEFIKAKKQGDFQLSAGLIFNYNTDKITKLFNGMDAYSPPNTGIYYVVGKPLSFYYPLYKGLNTETGELEWYEPGESIHETSKDKTTTVFRDDDSLMQNTGKTRWPRFNGGFNVAASFKGFSLQADFAYSLDKWLINNDLYFSDNPLLFVPQLNTSHRATDYWKQAGDNARYPSIKYAEEKNNSRFMNFDSRMLQNASFLRLKTLTLSYRLPETIANSKTFISGARIFLVGRNLLTFTKYDGPDPEADSNLSLGVNPNTKQITLGVELSF